MSRSPMIAVAGHLLLDPADRDRYVEVFRDLVTRARRADGCVELFITSDPVDPRRVNNFELWASQAELDAWRAHSDAPDPGIPIETGVMREYVIDHDRETFTTD